MHRLAVTLQGTLEVGRQAPGRGAWVCSAACFDLATRRKAFERALRRPVSKPDLERARATMFADLFEPPPEGAAEGNHRERKK
jgi:predicted RNA-binding protein YlxR (DUF448 family)